jgi:hypothetical protein
MDGCIVSKDRKVKCKRITKKTQVRMKYKQSKREHKKKKNTQWGATFSAPVPTGPGAYTASYTVGTGSLSRG